MMGGAAPAVLGAAGGMMDDHDHPTHGGGSDQGMMMHGGGDDMSGGGGGEGNLVLRPIFCGNLSYGCSAADLENVFRNPSGGGQPFDLDRVVSCYIIIHIYLDWVVGQFVAIDTYHLLLAPPIPSHPYYL